MGAGLRATLGILLGGVAQSVVDTPAARCWWCRHAAPTACCWPDGSLHSKAAVEYLAPHCEPPTVGAIPEGRPPDGVRPAAAAEARRCVWLPDEATVQVMHVLPPPLPPDAMRAWAVGQEAPGAIVFGEALAILETAGILRGISCGDATTYIRRAQKHEIDLVV
jgi:hypothetical protein